MWHRLVNMVSQKVIVLFLISVFSLSQQSPIEPFFRIDYEYIGRQEGFYKWHNVPSTWNKAVVTCAMEGAELVYPLSDMEAELLTQFLTQRLDNVTSGIWVGAHDIFAEGVYVNLEGIDLDKFYSSWSPGEPNDASNNEDCIMLTRSGKLNDNNCAGRFPYICKKDLATLTRNPRCETYDTGYVLSEDKTRCYKIHTTPKTWFDAFATCHGEMAYLAIINNDKEACFLKKMAAEKNITHSGCVAVGFNDLFNEGSYLTIYGKTLKAAGYSSWENGQPDNAKGGENCGCMKLNGLLNDYNCLFPLNFICERDLGDPYVIDSYLRFITE